MIPLPLPPANSTPKLRVFACILGVILANDIAAAAALFYVYGG